MAGYFRMNFRGLSKVFKSVNHVVNISGVHQFVSSSTFMKIYSVRIVAGNMERTFCSQVARSSEDAFDIMQASNKEEEDTNKIFEEIAAGDPSILKTLKMIEFEVAVLREEEHRVPDKIDKKHWQELLEIPSVNIRRKYLAFLRLNELKSMNFTRKSIVLRDLHQQRKQELGFHYYGLGGHSMFMRIYEKVVNRIHYQRLVNAKLDIVLDCSYDHYMSPLNLKLCGKQIGYCISIMKTHKYPSNFRVCNLSKDSALGKLMPLYSNSFYTNPFFEVHSESYLNLFPKERLLYLSPHAKTNMTNFNPDDVFIIGAYVDKGASVKASLAKAKEHNLRTAKLPIDEYLFWRKGSKSLPLCIVLKIILDMAFYNDWSVALKEIPKRCLSD